MGYYGFDCVSRWIGATDMMRSDFPKVTSRVRAGAKPRKPGVTYMKNGGRASKKSKGSKICPEGKAWAKRTFDTYPSAYANLAASKYCKDPNYAKKSKGGKRRGR